MAFQLHGSLLSVLGVCRGLVVLFPLLGVPALAFFLLLSSDAGSRGFVLDFDLQFGVFLFIGLFVFFLFLGADN